MDICSDDEGDDSDDEYEDVDDDEDEETQEEARDDDQGEESSDPKLQVRGVKAVISPRKEDKTPDTDKENVVSTHQLVLGVSPRHLPLP